MEKNRVVYLGVLFDPRQYPLPWDMKPRSSVSIRWSPRHEMNFFSTAQPVQSSSLDIQVTVTPTRAVFFAGDIFSAHISLSIVSPPSLPSPISAIHKPPATDRSTHHPRLPTRRERIGRQRQQTTELPQLPYSPGANTLHRACPSLPSIIPRQIGHGRRTRSLALGAVSPQEMIWALSASRLGADADYSNVSPTKASRAFFLQYSRSACTHGYDYDHLGVHSSHWNVPSFSSSYPARPSSTTQIVTPPSSCWLGHFAS